MEKNFKIKVKRYLPESEEVRIDEYEVPFAEDLTVLDALIQIKAEQDPTLTYRWSCRMAICGSCGAIANGKAVLMCGTFCHDLKQPILIEPLRNFPIIKDLVVDTDEAMDKFRDALPYTNFAKKSAGLDNETLQTPEEMEKFKQASQCIKCMLCYSACPVFGLDKSFVGPAAGAAALRYQNDSRDELKSERLDSMTSKDGVWKCSFIGECSVVCPKNVDPALALQKLKIMGVIHTAKSVLKSKK